MLIIDDQEAIEKAKRDRRADKQERDLVNRSRKLGWKAERVDGTVDVLVFSPMGIIAFDCKATDDVVFYLSKSDIEKGLSYIKSLKELLQYDKINFFMEVKFMRRGVFWINIEEHYQDYSLKLFYNKENLIIEQADGKHKTNVYEELK